MLVTVPSIVKLPSPVISFLFVPPVNVTVPSFSIPFKALTALAFIFMLPVFSTPILSVATITFVFVLLFINFPATVILD